MGGVNGKVFLSLPHQLERSELVDFRVSGIKARWEEQGYALSSPDKVMGLDEMDAQALVRLSMLISCDTVWFPKDFERSSLSVGEYNYAYLLQKTIVVDQDRRLLD